MGQNFEYVENLLILIHAGSLLATIHQIRPDIIPANVVPQGAKPIPAKEKEKKLSTIKKAVSSLGFMLPTQWTTATQPNGWYSIVFCL